MNLQTREASRLEIVTALNKAGRISSGQGGEEVHVKAPSRNLAQCEQGFIPRLWSRDLTSSPEYSTQCKAVQTFIRQFEADFLIRLEDLAFITPICSVITGSSQTEMWKELPDVSFFHPPLEISSFTMTPV